MNSNNPWQHEQIPFGKHCGKPLKDIPTTYLSWLLKQSWFADQFDELAESVESYLKFRSRPAQKPTNGITTDVVKRWHKTLVLKFHPDRDGGSHQAMVAVNAAHDLLLQLIGGNG